MSCKIFDSLFSQVDEITINFIDTMTAKSITMLKPVIIAGLTLSFIFYGLLIVRGLVEVPITKFFSKYTQIGLIACVSFSNKMRI